MAWLLGLSALFLLATETLQWDLSLTTGLSAKNLLMYLIFTFVALRMVVSRDSVMAAVQMQSAFIALILYALVTWLVAGLVIKYQSYDLIDSAIRLKTHLIDYYIFFLVFLFGLRTAQDCLLVIKSLLIGVVVANALTVADTVGVINLGFSIRDDGRVQGALGEANQYAAFIILFLPGMIAAAVNSKGLGRFFWLGGTLISAAALVMTASRGAFVGLIIALAAGVYLYRHFVNYSRVTGWVGGTLLVFVLVMSLSQYGDLLTERVFSQTGSIDVNTASSGRSEIWSNLLLKMFEWPITFITGFGWNVYWSFPFRFSPHNHYLSLWFNLGLVGIICGAYLLFSAIGRARRASLDARPPFRGQLVGFVLGTIAICVAVFFLELHQAWLYFWMYCGVAMRLVLCVEEMPVTERSSVKPKSRPRTARDPHGWAVPGRRLT